MGEDKYIIARKAKIRTGDIRYVASVLNEPLYLIKDVLEKDGRYETKSFVVERLVNTPIRK